ncbi:MAG: type VI secretion system contractile sheath small subunit [Polyangia bacterium]
MSESTQHKLDRVRSPRVHITYDVEIGGAIQMKELPMVVGVMADLAGQRDDLPKLKERKFIEIDRDNFNEVLGKLNPTLKFRVQNQLAKDGSQTTVDLKFSNIDDFHPTALAKQVPQLRALLEMRQRLIDLITKLDGNDELQAVLQKLLQDPAQLQAVRKALASKSTTDGEA